MRPEEACYSLVLKFFEGNSHKTKVWFDTHNPMVGATPIDLLRAGRADKLLKIIKGLMNI